MSLVWVNAVLRDRVYGGPEEGGWWYDECTVLESIMVPADLAARTQRLLQKRYADRDCGKPIHSVLCTGILDVTVNHERALNEPEHRPFYS